MIVEIVRLFSSYVRFRGHCDKINSVLRVYFDVDPQHFDVEPQHFDANPDPSFHFHAELGPTNHFDGNPFDGTRFLLLNKIMRNCDHWFTDHPQLHFEPSSLHC